MKHIRDEVLSTIVIDLHHIEALQVEKVVEENVDDVPTYVRVKTSQAREHSLFVYECLVANGEGNERADRRRRGRRP